MTFIHCLDRFVAAFGSARLYRRFLLKHLDWLTTFQFHSALIGDVPEYPVRTMRLRFPNRVGLGPGIDLRGERVTGFGALGFGFVEVGPIDSISSIEKNPKERQKQFLKSAEGFRLRGGIVGLSLNQIRNFEQFDFFYDRADFLVFPFEETLVKNVSEWRETLVKTGMPRKALVLELTSNNDSERVAEEVRTALKLGFDAVQTQSHIHENKRSSANPSVFDESLKAIQLARGLDPKLTLIANTGIRNAQDALRARKAGADLLCIQAGLFSTGLKLPSDCVKALVEH